MEEALVQIARYLLYSVLIQTGTFLVMVALTIYGFVQLRRDNREMMHEIGNLGAMTQNVAAMTREILRRTE
jgi:hypothetical protein